MRHEQAILVTLAYIIGFTTAFIAFALNSNYEKTTDVVAVKNNINLADSTQKVSTQSIKTLNNEEGLFMVKDGRTRILSGLVDKDVVDGYHLSVISASVSPDESYIHYCVNVGSEASSCSHFVYSIEADTIYKLKMDGNQVSTNGDQNLAVQWVNGNNLQFDTRIAGEDTNWILR